MQANILDEAQLFRNIQLSPLNTIPLVYCRARKKEKKIASSLCFTVVEGAVGGLVGHILVLSVTVLHQILLGQVQFKANVADTEI